MESYHDDTDTVISLHNSVFQINDLVQFYRTVLDLHLSRGLSDVGLMHNSLTQFIALSINLFNSYQIFAYMYHSNHFYEY